MRFSSIAGTGAAAAALLTGACAGPAGYGPSRDGGFGYAETRLDDNRFRVVFRGDRHSDRVTVGRHLHYRAAELTLRSGFDYFVLLRSEILPSSTAYAGGPDLRPPPALDEPPIDDEPAGEEQDPDPGPVPIGYKTQDAALLWNAAGPVSEPYRTLVLSGEAAAGVEPRPVDERKKALAEARRNRPQRGGYYLYGGKHPHAYRPYGPYGYYGYRPLDPYYRSYRARRRWAGAWWPWRPWGWWGTHGWAGDRQPGTYYHPRHGPAVWTGAAEIAMYRGDIPEGSQRTYRADRVIASLSHIVRPR